MLPSNCIGVAAWRWSACKVSGRRNTHHKPTTLPNTPRIAKIQRQPPNSSTAWPTLGARIGTIMNTDDMVELIRAIVSPE